MKIEKYSHVIWDFNGTLINDVAMCVDVLNMILRKYNIGETTTSQYIEDFAHPVRDYYVGLGFDFSVCDFDDVAVMFNTEYVRLCGQCSLQTYVQEGLDYFKEAGCQQSVLSAYQQQRLVRAIELFKLGEYFAEIAGLDDHYAHSKTERGQKLLVKLDVLPSEILLIGDTVHDHEVAELLGIDCVLIARGHNKKCKLENCGVPVFDSIKELVDNL